MQYFLLAIQHKKPQTFEEKDFQKFRVSELPALQYYNYSSATLGKKNNIATEYGNAK